MKESENANKFCSRNTSYVVTEKKKTPQKKNQKKMKDGF